MILLNTQHCGYPLDRCRLITTGNFDRYSQLLQTGNSGACLRTYFVYQSE